MTARLTHLAWATGLLGVCLGLSGPAAAQDDGLEAPPAIGRFGPDLAEEADLHFRLGVARYKKGDYEGALDQLLTSNRLVPNRNVVFNIARAYEQLGQFDQAFRHYDDYLSAETDPERRDRAERAVERIRDKVALLDLDTTPSGATVFVDRRDLGARGVTPRVLALPEGEHTVLLVRDGFLESEQSVTVAIGETTSVATSLEPILGEVTIASTPAGATVQVEGADPAAPALGTTPTTLRLPPGDHALVLSATGYVSERLGFALGTGEPTHLEVALAPRTGRVVIDALERGARIELDGAIAGFTPAVLDVPVGPHEILVTLPGYRPFSYAISVSADTESTVEVSLRSVQEVTAASRITQAAEDAPASVSVIPRREIEAFGYQSVYQALAGTRGIYQSNDLTYAQLGFRGFGRPGGFGNRVLITVDGHALNDDQLGASYIAEDLMVDLGDVERIEVVRGPGSALYGTNAFFGVINLVTRRDEPPRPHIAVTADGQRVGRARIGSGWGDRAGGGWVSLATLAGQGGDYYFPEYDIAGESDGWSRGADGTLAGTVHARAWSGRFESQVLLTGRHKRVATGAYDTLLADPRTTSSDLRGFAELRWEPDLSERSQLLGRVWADAYGYRGHFATAPVRASTDIWNGVWVGIEPRVVVRPWSAVRITAGAEARLYALAHLKSFDRGPARTDTYLDEHPTQQSFGTYAIVEAEAEDWLLVSAGARYDYFTLEDLGGDPIGPSLNPRAAVIVRPTDSDVIKLLGGTAYRTPSPYELFYQDDGFTQERPDELASERIATGELEVFHRFGEVTSLTVGAFYNGITRLVDTEPTGELGYDGNALFEYANLPSATRTSGVEVEVRRDWRRGFMLTASHSYQRSRRGDLLDGERLTNSPTHLFALKTAAPVVSGTSTLASQLRTESPRLTEQQTWTGWAVLWDLTLTGRLPAANIRWGIGVRNALDWKELHPGGLDVRQPALPQPGRTLFASIEASL